MAFDDEIWFHAVTFSLWTVGVAVLTWVICKFMEHSENATEEFFSGGRSLKWHVISGSLMLTNLSTEQLVGLNGAVFADGCLAGIWWEAGAALAMIVTATVFLPRYLILGLSTTSGFLSKRYDITVRTLVSLIFLIYYAAILCPLVLYTGALSIQNIFNLQMIPLWVISAGIGVIGSSYALLGGLRAIGVSDCFNGIGLAICGLWVPIMALQTLPNGLNDLFSDVSLLKPLVAESNLFEGVGVERSRGSPSVPWHVTLTGLALTNMYYWSTNQVIVQRVLAAKSLAQGQKGILYAASMKVVGFSFLCLPGIIGILMVQNNVVVNGKAFVVTKADEVYPEIVKAVMPKWSLGFLAGVLIGSVVSTFNAILNSAMTMFGLEVYQVLINRDASDKRTLWVSTVFGIILALVSFAIAPQLVHVDSIFGFLQRMNTIISLPIVTVFFVGIITSLPDAFAAKVGFGVALLSVCLGQLISELHFLHLFFCCFILSASSMGLVTYVPCVRRALCREAYPTPYLEVVSGALVETTPWRYLHPISTWIVALLAMLIVALQTGNMWLFYSFWFVWFVAFVALMALPVNHKLANGTAQKHTNSRTALVAFPTLFGQMGTDETKENTDRDSPVLNPDECKEETGQIHASPNEIVAASAAQKQATESGVEEFAV